MRIPASRQATRVDPRALAVVGKQLRIVGLDELPHLRREPLFDASLPEGQTAYRPGARRSELGLQRREPDESLCGLVREGLAGRVRRERLGVQRVLGAAAVDDRGRRAELHTHLAGDELLRLGDERVERLAQRREPEPVVDGAAPRCPRSRASRSARAFVSTMSSSARCAAISVIAAGAS